MSDQDNQQKPFSFDSEAAFVEIVNKIIGSHVTKRFENFETRLEGKFDQFLSKVPTQKEEKTEETAEKLSLKTLQTELQKVKAERDAEKNANRDKTLRAALNDHLSKSGMPAAAQKLAVSHLINEKLAFFDDKSNELQFRGEYVGETLPLSDGVQNWLKTEGKELLPPKTGANMRTVRTNPQTTVTGQTEAEQDAVIHTLLQRRREAGI